MIQTIPNLRSVHITSQLIKPKDAITEGKIKSSFTNQISMLTKSLTSSKLIGRLLK